MDHVSRDLNTGITQLWEVKA